MTGLLDDLDLAAAETRSTPPRPTPRRRPCMTGSTSEAPRGTRETEDPRRAIAIVGVGADPARRSRRAAFWSNVTRRPLLDQRRPARALGSRRSTTTPTPRPRQDLLEDRRLGARVPWDPIALEAADPAARRRRDGRRPAVGGGAARDALLDYGLAGPAARPRAHGGDHGQRAWRRQALHHRAAHPLPGVRRRARGAPAFAALPPDVRAAIAAEARAAFLADLPTITEDTMPGELANIIAGRIANLFNLHGPNFVCDAACASAMAAMNAAIAGLDRGRLRRGADRRHRPQHGRRAPSSSSARSARCRPPAPGPTPTAPTAS